MILDGASILRKGLPFATVSEVSLCALVERGQPLTLSAGSPLLKAGDAPDGIYIILSGEIFRRAASESLGSEGALLERLEQGSAFGAAQLLFKKTWGDDFFAGSVGQTKLLRIPADALRDVLRRDYAFGRSVRFFASHFDVHGAPIVHVDGEQEESPTSRQDPPLMKEIHGLYRAPVAELVAYRHAKGSPSKLPLGILMECTARAIAEDSARLQTRDNVLVVRIVAGSDAPGPIVNLGTASFVRVGKGAFPSVLNEWNHKFHYIFLDTYDLSPEGEEVALPPGRPVSTVWVGPSSAEGPPVSGEAGRSITLRVLPPSLKNSLLSRWRVSTEAPNQTPASERRAREQTNLVIDAAVLQQVAQRGDHDGTSRLPSGMNLRDFFLAVDRATPDAHVTAGEGFSRAGRCLCQRLLGVALGGGGALGFAHIPLLQKMRLAELPIDLISGTSFGAVVAAYYCAKPKLVEDPNWGVMPEGLSLLLSQIPRLQCVVNACFVTNAPAIHFYNRDLDFCQVGDLPVLCAPVATNIDNGSSVPIMNGSIGFAVTASGSAPALFVPTTTKTARYVDGGVVNNVPADIAGSMGASLVVTSNPIPGTTEWSPPPPCFPGWLGRQIYQFNPIYRAIDGVRSIYALASAYSNATADAVRPRGRVSFQASDLPVLFKGLFFDFSIAPAVMNAAYKSLEDQGTIQTIEQRWSEMCAVDHHVNFAGTKRT